MCFFSVTVPVFCSFLKAVFPPTAAVAHPAVHGGRISLWVRLSWGLYLFFFPFSYALMFEELFRVAYPWSTVRNFTWAFDASIWHVFFFTPSTLQHPTKIVTDLFIVLLWAKNQEANMASSNSPSRIRLALFHVSYCPNSPVKNTTTIIRLPRFVCGNQSWAHSFWVKTEILRNWPWMLNPISNVKAVSRCPPISYNRVTGSVSGS